MEVSLLCPVSTNNLHPVPHIPFCFKFYGFEQKKYFSCKSFSLKSPHHPVPYYDRHIVFIGPESDHCLPLSLTDSLTDWLTHSCLVDFIDVTLACEDANSKLVDVVTIADDDRVGNNLLQISKLRFGQKAKLLFRLWAQGSVKILKLKFRQDLGWPVFFYRSFVEVMKLNLGQDSEARFGQDFEAFVLWRGWCLVKILKLMLGRDSEDEIWSRFV